MIDETGNCTIVSGQLRYILIVLSDWLTARKLMLSWNVVNFAHAIYEHRATKTVELPFKIKNVRMKELLMLVTQIVLLVFYANIPNSTCADR